MYMKKQIKSIGLPLWITVVFIILSVAQISAVTVAFDLTKAETAGNADWTIGSSPNWTGAYSEFGVALRNLGFTTTTLTGSNITASMLTNVKVLVLPEPQNPFTASEKTVLLNFVQNGGGLFLIADHEGSDRNNNGWDSRRVYNESLLVQTNFGISFDENSLYANPTAIFESPITQITNGLSQVGMYAGCSITPSGTATTRIWLRNSSEEGLVTNTYGTGRVAAYGDSSPFDDGTGNSGNELYDGWNDYDNAQFGVNVVQWLAQQNASGLSFTSPVIIPSQPVTNQPIEVRINIQPTQSMSFVFLYWKTTGGFNPVEMTLLSGTTYKAIIPALLNPAVISYYVMARTSSNYTGYYPTGAPTTLATISVSPTANEDEVMPAPEFRVYPNPLNLSKQSLTIQTMPNTDISIYDSKGRLIQSFYSDEKSINWNGMDTLNRKCSTGIYYIKLSNKIEQRTLPLVIIR